MPITAKQLSAALECTQNPEYPEVDLICEECYEKYTTTYKNSKLCPNCFFGKNDSEMNFWGEEQFGYWKS